LRGKIIVDLTIIHTTYHRLLHLKAFLGRLELNKMRNPHVDFECIVLDGNSPDGTREFMESYLERAPFKLRYIFVPFNGWTNPSLPRNICLRYADGEICCSTDADHWISEDFIYYALEPYRNGISNALNFAMVHDSSKSLAFPPTKINQFLLNEKVVSEANIITMYDQFRIPKKEPKSEWIIAYPREAAIEAGGYDEEFAGKNWARDETMFGFALHEVGLKDYKEDYLKFAAIHLWHDVANMGIRRNSAKNHKIFQEKLKNIGEVVAKNRKKKWGTAPVGTTINQNF
jgi:glycosyltransferase involved in cell wall biosynthesis